MAIGKHFILHQSTVCDLALCSQGIDQHMSYTLFVLPVLQMDSERTFTERWDQSDVSFTVDDRNIYANKATLSMWSPVFNAMFGGAFMEGGAATVDLPGKQYNNVLELIRVLHPPNKPVGGKLSHV